VKVVMRDDMAHVIIDRPRWGHRHPQRGLRRRRRERPDGEEHVLRASMKGTSWSKTLNENLQPLWRALLKSVGRPWDRVHAEVCASIAMDSAVQKHVRDHVKQFVHLDVVLVDEVPWRARSDRLVPLGEFREELYRHPRTGLLCLARARGGDPRLHVVTHGTHSYARVRGVWCELTLTPLPEPFCFVRDVVLGDVHSSWRARLTRSYGRPGVYASAARVLSRVERVHLTQGGPARVR
jgi:hypothetical protein